MTTTTQRNNDSQSSFLSAVRESQAAILDVIRVWNDIGEQLTRSLRLPAADVAGAIDRAFDVAEQTLPSSVSSRAPWSASLPARSTSRSIL